jgi:predicted AAA+ superfamily ATPase
MVIIEISYMFERKLASIITELLDEFRIIYLTGPRQAGKTTLGVLFIFRKRNFTFFTK